MNIVTIEEVSAAETQFMKLRAAYEALDKPIEPRVIRGVMASLEATIDDDHERIERLEKILWEISIEACQKHGLQIIPF